MPPWLDIPPSQIRKIESGSARVWRGVEEDKAEPPTDYYA
jgi:hypothetical protein